jgi:hypothetical protein
MDSTTQNTSNNMREKKEEFHRIASLYLESNPLLSTNNKTSELEVRFGTNPRIKKPITKTNYDNVIKQLYSCGFKTENNNGNQMLRIQNEYTDPRTGQTKMSNIRAEIVGTDLIQHYCETNDIQKLVNMPSNVFNKIKFTRKSFPKDKQDKFIQKLDMEDFNFRVSFQEEQDFNIHSNIARNIMSKWVDSKKIFRSLNRVRFYHETYPIFADLTIVKSSKVNNRVPIPQYNIQDAGVFTNIEHYEIELEVDNARVGSGTEFDNAEKLLAELRKVIRIVLSGIQDTKYPVSYSEQDEVMKTYMEMLHGEEYEYKRVLPKHFVGPSSYTLQLSNIIKSDTENSHKTILKDYTVTDKADGERRLLYVHNNGKIYMIDTNMRVIFTGSKTTKTPLFNSLIDGEFIKYDKNRQIVNLYAAFDMYYINGKSVRHHPFMMRNEQESSGKSRMNLLVTYVEELDAISILDKAQDNEVKPKNKSVKSGIRIQVKEFEHSTDEKTIFKACSNILSKVKDDNYEYETDGLIFTPAFYPVGADSEEEEPSSVFKTTWNSSFKWKPPQFNTIDFLVSVEKTETGRDKVSNIYQDGISMDANTNIIQYKTLTLRCGYDERKHGFLNPCQDILNDNLHNSYDVDSNDDYKPVPFVPTHPYDENAHVCNVILKKQGDNSVLLSEEGEYFEEDMIVEFKYVQENKDGWKWVPLRVRYDKTAELKAGLKNYGNAYHVANSNWRSIHHPITEEMIGTGENIPEYVEENDVYYSRSHEQTSTQGLRDFHNLVVKRSLITGVSNRGDTLIDYAVGKAGDLSKWSKSKLKFVFGVDISRDNIYNRIDGACARYLNLMKKYKNSKMRAMFLRGTSGANIRNGSAFETDKDKQIAKAIFGNGPKDSQLLGKGVYNQYGIGEQGFQISSCQFAMHYFFENKDTLYEFVRNLSECTKVDGYFIGTCYDGRTVFNMLKNKEEGESIPIMKDGRKIYEITKMYNKTGFPDDEQSLGYNISIYQESINKTFVEYLVNFDYFIREMENYGFVIVPTEDATHINLPSGTGMFSDLFKQMEDEIEKNPNMKNDVGQALYMTPEEKRISFMNRYFVFKKVRNVNMTNKEKVNTEMIHTQIEELESEEIENKQTKSATKETKNVEEPKATVQPKKIRKNKKKLVIEKN